MSHGRLLDHHWVERTTVGQTAWRESPMPPPERGLLSALRAPMKLSELYRKLGLSDPQAFLDLVNGLSRRGWVSRMDEPTVDEVPVAPPAVVVSDASTFPSASTLGPRSPLPTEMDRPSMSKDLQAMLARYRGERDSSNSGSSENPPVEPSLDKNATLETVAPIEQEPHATDHAQAVEAPPLVNPSLEAQEVPIADASPMVVIEEILSPLSPLPKSVPASLAALLAEPAPEPMTDTVSATVETSPLSAMLDDPAFVVPPIEAVLEYVGPLAAVDDVRVVAIDENAFGAGVTPTPTKVVDSTPWSGMTSLEALQRALMTPDVDPHSSETGHERVGEPVFLHTLPSDTDVPSLAPEGIVPTVVEESAEESLANFLLEQSRLKVRSPLPASHAHEARASDLGPKGPSAQILEDEDDLMRSLSRPKRLMPGTKLVRRSSTSSPKNDAFQEQVRAMQAMKDDARRQEEQRKNMVARRLAEEDARQAKERARKENNAMARAEAQRKEDAQSLSSLADRMKRMKKRDTET